MAPTIRNLTWIVALWLFYGVSLACLDPFRQAVESDGFVTRLNHYAKGSKLCITEGFKRENDCYACVKNFYHECTATGWKKTYRDCGPSQQDLGNKDSFDLEGMIGDLNANSIRFKRDSQDANQRQERATNEWMAGAGLANPGLSSLVGTPNPAQSASRGVPVDPTSEAELERACPGISQAVTNHFQKCERMLSSKTAGLCVSARIMERCATEAARMASGCNHPAMLGSIREFQETANSARQTARSVCSE